MMGKSFRRIRVPRFRAVLLASLLIAFVGYFAFVVVGSAAKVGTYALGFSDEIGYRSGRYRSWELARLGVIPFHQRFSWSIGFGTRTFFVQEGQQIEVDYDVDIRLGWASVVVTKWPIPDLDALSYRSVSESESGVFRYTVPDSGFYKVQLRPGLHRRDPGYDIAYTMRWGARSAAAVSVVAPSAAEGLRRRLRGDSLRPTESGAL
jgi:hypothetical protein